MARPEDLSTTVIYKDPHAYSSWPDITILEDGDWIIAFSQAMRRHRRTHRDPTFHNLIVRSKDQGRTWDRFPQGVPGYHFFGIDGIAVTELSNGDLLAHTVRDLFVTLDTAERAAEYASFRERRNTFPRPGEYRHVAPFPWVFTREGTYVIRSTDAGHTWEDPILVDLSPFQTGFSPRPIVELGDGALLLPQSEEALDPPQAFVVRSTDAGRTWGNATLVAKNDRVGFWEPALLVLSSGRIISMLRTHKAGDYHLHQSVSFDGGWTWTNARKTPMRGYPAHMLQLTEGRILCAYGYRFEPYGIRACLSSDEGETWDIENELIIRDDLPNADLGYPTSAQLEDGTIFTTYYAQDEGVTCIMGSTYKA